jgi:hypothetical protein
LTDRARRKELLAQYNQARPEAGVYRLVNSASGRTLLASAPDLAAVRNKLEFAKAHDMPSVLDYRLHADFRQYGADSFVLEVLDVLAVTPEMTPEQIRADLSALLELWRERMAPELLY